MASQKAKQIDFLLAGYTDSSGNPYKKGKVYFWESSAKTTAKTVWQDRNKASSHSQPVILGNSGEATVFGDGEYYIEIYDKNDVLVKTLNLVNYSAEVDFGGLYVDVGSLYGFSGPNIQSAIDDLNVAQNYVLLFKDGDFTVSQDITVPTNAMCKVMPTADISVSSGFTFTPNGNIDAGEYAIFSGSGTVSLPNQKVSLDVWGGSISSDGVYVYSSGKVGLKTNTQSKSSDFTVTSNDSNSTFLVDDSSGDVTVSFEAASVLGAGFKCTIIKTNSSTNNLVLTPDGSETIDGSETLKIKVQYQSYTVISDSANLISISPRINRYQYSSETTTNEVFTHKKYYDIDENHVGGQVQWSLSMDYNTKVKLVDGGTFIGEISVGTERSGSTNDSLSTYDVYQDSYDPDNSVSQRSFGHKLSWTNITFSSADVWLFMNGETGETNEVDIIFKYTVGKYMTIVESPSVVAQ